MFSLPMLLIYCNDRRIMGIQHCNMNMKFAALLIFVGVTSATWCWDDGSNKCPDETVHGQATTTCCKVVGGRDGEADDRGCWLVGEKMITGFLACCTAAWDCSTDRN
jgi:hypothetical protein